MRKLLATLIIVLSTSSFSSAQDMLTISGHPNYPPFMWQQDEVLVGASVELAESVFKELNVPLNICACGPWKRVQDYARRGKIDVIVGLYANPERAQYIDFSCPYITDPTVVFVKKERGFSFKRWEDLIGKKGTSMQGESYGAEMDAFIAGHLTMARMLSIEANFMRLVEGRSDYFLSGYYPGMIYAKKLGYWDKIEVLPDHVLQQEMYMGISKKSPVSSLLPEINRIVKRLKADGQIQNWVDTYLEFYLEKVGQGSGQP